MSRSDLWSIAATLIVTGAGYFLGGQKAAYGAITLGIAIGLYLVTTSKKKDETSPTISQRAEVNPQINTNVSPHFHFSAPTPEKADIKPQAWQPIKPKPRHNLGFHSCDVIQIDVATNESGLVRADDQSRPNAFVVYIKNKSTNREVARVDEVRAAISFRDENGTEVASVSQGIWLDNCLMNADFGLEQSRCLVLATILGPKKLAAPYAREHRGEDGGLFDTLDAHEIAPTALTAEIILVSNTKRLIPPIAVKFAATGKPWIEYVDPGLPSISSEEL
jgi:hypothetical protein